MGSLCFLALAAAPARLLLGGDPRCDTKTSARNMLKGTVRDVRPGTVNSVITLELPGGMPVVAMITEQSAENLKLAAGKEAYAVIKASNVMVAVD